MSTKQANFEFAETSRDIFLGLLAYMPFHIFLSTWIGTSFGVLASAKIAKDGILIVGFSLALAASIRQPWFKKLLQHKLIWLILGFSALNLLLAIFRSTDQDAETLGLVYNTRFFVFFLYAILIKQLFSMEDIRRRALRIVMIAGVLVMTFGIVQYAVLPDDALTHVGYRRSNGVLPAFFIDNKPDLERIMSTVRDPNSLGSYLIIIGSIALAFFIKGKGIQLRKIALWILILSLSCLWFTFSRSAWIGFAVAAVLIFRGNVKNLIIHKLGKYKVFALGLVVFIIGFSLFMARGSYFVQNVVFHADEATVLEDPNQLRLRFWQESVEDVGNEPLGHGPGTAGLASIRNDVQGTVLNENYYLQMAHELGVFGLLLFLGTLVIIGKRLYELAKESPVALALFASFIGLAITNLFVHIWANEAVAYTWWGLAGLVLFTAPESSVAVRGKAKRQSA